MDTDIRDEIERSFGDGPPSRDPARVIELGHQALRRRRIAESASMLVVAAVAVTGVLVATSGSTVRATPPIAENPSASASSASDPPPSAPPGPYDVVADGVGFSRGVYAEMHADGVIHVRPGTQVVTLLRNPWKLDQPGYAVALEVRHGGELYWTTMAADDQGGGASQSAAQPRVRFEDWVAENPIELTHPDGPPPDSGPMPGRPDLDLVRFVPGTEQLMAEDGVTLIEQRPHPQIGESFAAARDRSAAAEVRLDGERWYVLARDPAQGAAQYVAVAAADGGPTTLDDFLDFARERYAENGGGLL